MENSSTRKRVFLGGIRIEQGKKNGRERTDEASGEGREGEGSKAHKPSRSILDYLFQSWKRRGGKRNGREKGEVRLGEGAWTGIMATPVDRTAASSVPISFPPRRRKKGAGEEGTEAVTWQTTHSVFRDLVLNREETDRKGGKNRGKKRRGGASKPQHTHLPEKNCRFLR